MNELVLGYGSLVAEEPRVPCRLRDHGRGWGVAMDNRRTIPGYKYYEYEDGVRPPVYVAFLDIWREPGSTVDGVAFPVTTADLDELDRRERNYDRTDVTDLIDADLGERVWTYVGSVDGRARFERGRREGTLVVARPYLEDLGSSAGDLHTDLPVEPLRRIDVPELTRA